MPSMRLIFRRALSHPERHRAEGDRHLRRRFRVTFSLFRQSGEALRMLQAHRCSNHVACAATAARVHRDTAPAAPQSRSV